MSYLTDFSFLVSAGFSASFGMAQALPNFVRPEILALITQHLHTATRDSPFCSDFGNQNAINTFTPCDKIQKTPYFRRAYAWGAACCHPMLEGPFIFASLPFDNYVYILMLFYSISFFANKRNAFLDILSILSIN